MTAETAVICFSLMLKSFDSLLAPFNTCWRFKALRKVPSLSSLSISILCLSLQGSDNDSKDSRHLLLSDAQVL